MKRAACGQSFGTVGTTRPPPAGQAGEILPCRPQMCRVCASFMCFMCRNSPRCVQTLPEGSGPHEHAGLLRFMCFIGGPGWGRMMGSLVIGRALRLAIHPGPPVGLGLSCRPPELAAGARNQSVPGRGRMPPPRPAGCRFIPFRYPGFWALPPRPTGCREAAWRLRRPVGPNQPAGPNRPPATWPYRPYGIEATQAMRRHTARPLWCLSICLLP